MRYFFLALSLIFFSPVQAKNSWKPALHINNRILWNYNEKVITAVDVAKELDFVFDAQTSKEQRSNEARLSFYLNNWQPVLVGMIDKELIYKEALDKQMQVQDSEVREDLIRMYGEDLTTALDQEDLSYKKAFEKAKKELLIQRMVYFQVQYKASSTLSPKKLSDAYSRFCESFKSGKTYDYHIVTIKGQDQEACLSTAKELERLFNDKNWEAVTASCNEISEKNDQLQLNASTLYSQIESGLSPNYLKALNELKEGEISTPQNFSKKDAETSTYRLFFLSKLGFIEPPSFQDVQKRLEGELLEEEMAKARQRYIKRLRKESRVEEDETLAEAFNSRTPLFELK